MTTTTITTPRPAATTPAAGSELRRDALGISTLFFATATAIAPLTAALLGVPLVVFGVGWAAPAGFLVAAAMLAVFAVGYVEMARRLRSAGGFYTFVSAGLGRVLGLGTASMVTTAYGVFTASLIGAFAYFTSTTIESWTEISIPVWAPLVGALVVNLAFAYFEVRITARVLGAFFVAELAGLLVFALVVLVQGGAEGLTAAPLNPLAILDNEGAIAVFGAAAPGIALYSAFSSWLGFEMAPSYSEETRSRRGVAWVTIGTLLVMAVVYVLVSYAFVVGYGPDAAAAGVASQFQGQVASAFYPLTDRYAGTALTHAFELLIVTSVFAAQLAVFNVAARYLFALGRDGVLPRALGRTHGRLQTPHVASGVVAVALALYIGAFQLHDASRDAALLKLAIWSSLLGILGVIAAQALTSFAIVAYFRRVSGASRWRTLVAPLAGGGLMVFSAYLVVDNRETLAGAEGAPFVEAIPWTVVAAFAAGATAALWRRARDAAGYRAVGQVVTEDGDPTP
jgi:amino acid transporter